ncbi:ABC transporter permease [Pandoraea sputorum]|uniref:ABC transporter permease n=1 Tax=Pandoraea sputorum TaxID=93222 RepID=UPI00123FDB48|nr:ABC transporter permease [Pandoraea sputorum]VVE55033.1 Putrescine transport system permease protein PotH [Pandoraea sputorum]
MTNSLDRRYAIVLLLPAGLLLGIFFFYPLAVVAWTSVYHEGLTLDAYKGLFRTALFSNVFATTAWIAFVATSICVVIGYCLAAWIARMSGRTRVVLITCVMLPLWTSVLVKSFALTVVLGDSGIVNQCLVLLFGDGARVSMMFNRAGVLIGMVNYLLPFAVFPILASLLGIDPVLRRVAELMGAGPLRTFLQVTLPLSLPGVFASALMTMTLAMGMFVTPALLGGRKDLMTANLIELYTRQILDWQGASAIAMVLLVVSMVLILFLLRVQKDEAQPRESVR